MPNLKIYVDEAIYPASREALVGTLGDIHRLLCRDLDVPPAACQIAMLPMVALPDLPRIGVELHILPRPDRTRDMLTDLSLRLRDLLFEASGVQAAVRVILLDPQTYVALK